MVFHPSIANTQQLKTGPRNPQKLAYSMCYLCGKVNWIVGDFALSMANYKTP